MKPQRESLLQLLVSVARAMPEAQLREVANFAEFLLAKHDSSRPARGSADALLRHAGSLRFEPGEADRLLTEIDEIRRMDLALDV